MGSRIEYNDAYVTVPQEAIPVHRRAIVMGFRGSECDHWSVSLRKADNASAVEHCRDLRKRSILLFDHLFFFNRFRLCVFDQIHFFHHHSSFAHILLFDDSLLSSPNSKLLWATRWAGIINGQVPCDRCESSKKNGRDGDGG